MGRLVTIVTVWAVMSRWEVNYVLNSKSIALSSFVLSQYK